MSGFRIAKALMGKVVLVTAVLDRVVVGTKVTWNRKPVRRAGWVTGGRTVYGGRIEGGNYSYDPPYFVPHGAPIDCLLVVFWPNRNPVHVPLDGYENPTDNLKVFLAARAPESDSRCTWDSYEGIFPSGAARCRSEMRGYAADMKRDKQGRFMRAKE
jgi:hypothetical protein